jgi:hypothetical protein
MANAPDLVELLAMAGAAVARDGKDHWRTIPELSREQHRKYARARLAAIDGFGFVITMKPKRRPRHDHV